MGSKGWWRGGLILGLLALTSGCASRAGPTSWPPPFAEIPFQSLWEEAFAAAWAGWALQARACGEAGAAAAACWQALRPTLSERVGEAAAQRKEARGITAPYVASILEGWAQRPEQAAGLLVLAMAGSPPGERRERLRAAFEALPQRFQRLALSPRTRVRPLSHPGAGAPPERWAQYYLSQEWGLLRAAVAAWRPPLEEEIGCADLISGESLCPLLAQVRPPSADVAFDRRLEELFRGAFDYADAFARSERFLQTDPAAVRAALAGMVREAQEALAPREGTAARERLAGKGRGAADLEAAWDQVEARLFGPAGQ